MVASRFWSLCRNIWFQILRKSWWHITYIYDLSTCIVEARAFKNLGEVYISWWWNWVNKESASSHAYHQLMISRMRETCWSQLQKTLAKSWNNVLSMIQYCVFIWFFLQLQWTSHGSPPFPRNVQQASFTALPITSFRNGNLNLQSYGWWKVSWSQFQQVLFLSLTLNSLVNLEHNLATKSPFLQKITISKSAISTFALGVITLPLMIITNEPQLGSPITLTVVLWNWHKSYVQYHTISWHLFDGVMHACVIFAKNM